MQNKIVLPHSAPEDSNIPLVVSGIREESATCISLIFVKPENFLYTAGNWMDIRFFSPELAIGKTFSFSSAPTEENLMITFKKGISPFKKALEAVQVGDTVYITQYGNNGFVLDTTNPSVLIAGGVGIAPFRSMIKQVVDTYVQVPIQLLYLNHTEVFPYKKELDTWKNLYTPLQITYIITGNEGRITKEKLENYIDGTSTKKYYIAGSPDMVSTIESMLVSSGVLEKLIKIDSFDGY